VVARGFRPGGVDRSARAVNGRARTTDEVDMFAARLPGSDCNGSKRLPGSDCNGSKGSDCSGSKDVRLGSLTLMPPRGAAPGTLRVWNYNGPGLGAARGVRGMRVLLGGAVPPSPLSY
jgi:hypothetical protein